MSVRDSERDHPLYFQLLNVTAGANIRAIAVYQIGGLGASGWGRNMAPIKVINDHQRGASTTIGSFGINEARNRRQRK